MVWTKQAERRSLVLLPEEWGHLDALAEELDTCPPTGSRAGQPSWRSLIKEVARGELAVTRPEPEQEEEEEGGEEE
jgi:hypothetical protein